jgi:predicted nucleic acid-binding protein
MNARVRSTGASAVFDASVFVRATVRLERPAIEWIRRAMQREVVVSVPDLVFPEVGNALRFYVRDATLTLSGALRRVRFVRRIPLEVRGIETLVEPAVGLAVSRGLTVYDACYAVLAEAEGAVLITADNDLATAVTRAELI